MATIIKGMLSHNLPWGLVLIGMGIAAVVELCGINSLAFAVGSYLPISTTVPIFMGGLVKWLVNKSSPAIGDSHSELEPGTLYCSGLIAGGALAGILIATLLGTTYSTSSDGKTISYADLFNTSFGENMGIAGDLIALGAFLILAVTIYGVAKRNTILK